MVLNQTVLLYYYDISVAYNGRHEIIILSIVKTAPLQREDNILLLDAFSSCEMSCNGWDKK